MRILVITSSLAYDMAKEVVSKIKGHEVIVYRLDYPVASLMTTTYIANELVGRIRDRYDYVLIPGLALGDASVIKPIVGCEVFKGPRYLGDLPEVVRLLEAGVKLSTTLPADEVLKDYLKMTYEYRMRELLRNVNYVFTLGDLGIPLRSPPLILAYEVMLKDRSEYEGALERVRRSCSLGADIVVIGSPIDREVPLDLVDELISEVKYGLKKPVGIDIPLNVVQRLRNEVDLIMNVSHDVIKSLTCYRDKAVVIVPSDVSSIGTCIASLTKVLELTRNLGFNKVIVDPILKPPQLGLAESLTTYYHVSRALRHPLMMGASNVYELMDVDSHSTIALLTSIAIELGVSILLITEESVKSYNAIAEAVRARDMVYRAYIRKSPPIDVGLDMLVVKEKRRRRSEPLSKCMEEVVVRDLLQPRTIDKYYVKVYVSRDKGHIIVEAYDASSNTCVRRYVGSNALTLCRKLANDFKDSISGEHYAYLGYELCKAELALKLGKSYIQDEPLFT